MRKQFFDIPFGTLLLARRISTVMFFALCSMLIAPRFPVEAQQPKKVPRIGFLTLRSTPSDQDEAFKQALRDFGWIEGQNFTIEWRGAAGKTEKLADLAADLVRMKVNVIVASATPSVEAAKNATSTIPIVMSSAADPVGIGLVASLARPGGNITGLSMQSPELAGKRMELLTEIIPKLVRVAFLAYGPDPAHRLFVKEAQEAAESLKMQIQLLVLGNPGEIEGAFSKMLRERAGALVIQPLFVGGLGQGRRVVELATKNRLPTISDGTQFAEQGGLIYYGPSRIELARRTAALVDKILKGAKPAELPVEQPTKFDLVINLKAAKQIGLTIPPNVLARADKVIR
jgi:putative tryptophan/tyrosine transport system substrate-binding protein